ncbi:MAG: CoA-binding protein [Burkholderiales bacterium]|nr:MAG: CoA-binding protein [Burkholderiales bacterium]
MRERRLIERILKTCRTIAVVGLSDRPDRPSYGVAQYMQSKGYRIIPVNPNAAEILGEKSYGSLLDIPHPVDMVNVFRRTADVLPIAQQAVQIKAKCLWQQIGIANEEADALAKGNGLLSVMDLCLKIEHRLLAS